MREILFRGKRKDNGEWVCGMPWIFKDHACVCPWHEGMCKYDTGFYPVHVIPETVGQFTGLADKNGKKIFDGDIVKDEHTGSVARIAYLPQACGWVLVFKNTDCRLGHRSRDTGYTDDRYLEIVGNIHDNPELLEVADNAVATEGSIG